MAQYDESKSQPVSATSIQNTPPRGGSSGQNNANHRSQSIISTQSIQKIPPLGPELPSPKEIKAAAVDTTTTILVKMYKLSTADKSQCCDGLSWERFRETCDRANRTRGEQQQQQVTIRVGALLGYRPTRSSSFRRRKSEILNAADELLLTEEGGSAERRRTTIFYE